MDPTVKPDDLRAAIQREPFLAFEVHTQAGRTYPVVHPENIAFSPRVNVVLIKYGESKAPGLHT